MKTATVAIIAALVIATALASSPTAFAYDAEPLIAPVCLADLNADSIVDRADLVRLLSSYGACKGCEEDLDQDNFVDNADVAITIRQWGPCRPEGDVFGGDYSGDSLVGGSDSLTDDADSLSGPDMDRTTTTLVPPRCQGDLNGDTFVDEEDMTRLLRHSGACKGCEEDLNQDNFVDDADVAIMTRQWGPCRPEGDVFGGDHSNGSLVGGSDSLADGADSLSGADLHRTTTTLVEPRCDGDLNGDNIVDRHDVIQMLDSFGRCRGCDEDLNGDGFVDETDMRILMADWGWCPGVTQLTQAVRAASKTAYSPSESDSLVEPGESFSGQDETVVPEDVNGDSMVDMDDILTVAEHVGQEPTGDKAFSDVNNDGRIDEHDIRAIAMYVITGESIGG